MNSISKWKENLRNSTISIDEYFEAIRQVVKTTFTQETERITEPERVIEQTQETERTTEPERIIEQTQETEQITEQVIEQFTEPQHVTEHISHNQRGEILMYHSLEPVSINAIANFENSSSYGQAIVSLQTTSSVTINSDLTAVNSATIIFACPNGCGKIYKINGKSYKKHIEDCSFAI